MAKLTKAQAKAHGQAVEILQQDVLSWDDREFVYRNWNEGANHANGAAGAFFTPFDLAFDFAIDAGGGRVIDLCAGIGMLSYAINCRSRFAEAMPELVCVERNYDYVEVGKKLLPEAKWIHADVLDVLEMELGRFDTAISNPPFGNIKRSKNAPRYTGKDFEFHVVDIAAHLADHGTFILPQGSSGFFYSGRQNYCRQTEGKAIKFQELTGLHFDAGCGVDTSCFLNEWKGVSPLCEIVCVEFPIIEPPEIAPAAPANDNQLTLFGEAA